MKFWQLLDIFRDEQALLLESFKKDEWRLFHDHFLKIKDFVLTQDRGVLDQLVDERLLFEICSKSKKNIFLSIKKSKIYSYKSSDSELVISISDAVKMFKHDLIEEVFEKSEADILLE